ncbi:BatA domain-containing protein [Alphaproteobacteria bacterium]|nr:BatA domain-containing protein [Alphaproteobacteria bacterium]
MLNIINTLAFTNYYALLGLLALPLIFLIIKALPPSPKKMFFSSFYLINKLEKTSVTKNNIPFWLLIYRIILITLIVLFFSKPYLNSTAKTSDADAIKSYVIIADIGWSMSKEWEKFKKIVNAIGNEAEKKNKEIIFYF